MPLNDDIPPLDDPAHDPVRGELARLFMMHKADLGLADRPDVDIVARVDDIMVFMMQRHGNALLANDTAWLNCFRWFSGACDRLAADERTLPLDV